MSKVIRRAAAVILAIAMALPCVTAFAADSTATKVVEIDAIAKSWASMNKDGSTSEGGDETWYYLPLHNATSVKASGAGTKITVSANTTTMPKYVQIQYSRDKAFKNGVSTKKVKNTKYNAKKQALFTIKGMWNGSQKNEKYSTGFLFAAFTDGKHLTPANITFNAGNLAKGGLASKAAALKVLKTSSYIDKSRAQVKASGTYTLTGIKNPSAYYVRVRNVYEYNGKTYYSAWKTVKVQSANNKVSSSKASK